MRYIPPTLNRVEKSYIMQTNLIKLELAKIENKLKRHKSNFSATKTWNQLRELKDFKDQLILINANFLNTK